MATFNSDIFLKMMILKGMAAQQTKSGLSEQIRRLRLDGTGRLRHTRGMRVRR